MEEERALQSIRAPAAVTGATGFIGRRLVGRLRGAGIETRALLLPGEGVPPEFDEVQCMHGDVRNPGEVAAFLDGAGTVFHLAALVAEQNADYDAHWSVTAEGSRNVYSAASARKIRVVVTTSICAYGERIARDECREESERGAHQGPYGRAKQAQEDFALESHERDGLAVTILRPSNVYGAGSRPWVQMLAELLAAGSMMVVGDGSGNAGLVHVENVIDALVLAAAREQAIGRIYNVCDGLPISWRQYIDDMAAIVGAPPPPGVARQDLYALALANEDPAAGVGPRSEEIPPLEMLNLIGSDNRFPTERIRSELGWVPRVGYEAALDELRGFLALKER